MAPCRVLYWFRTDLRVRDSPALCTALALPGIEALYPVWCFDPTYVYQHNVGINRWNFLLESMQELSDQLKLLNDQQKLLVVRGSPQNVLPEMWRQWGITHLVYEKDSAAYARTRDTAVNALAQDAGVEVIAVHGHHLYDPDLVVKANKGKPTATLGQWKKAAGTLGSVPRPSPTPARLPLPGKLEFVMTVPAYSLVEFEELDLNGHTRTGRVTCFDTLCGPENSFAVPTMASLGLPSATTTITGGTVAALTRLDAYSSDASRVALFEKPKTAPTALEPSTTLMSPYLKFGCLGIREFWWKIHQVVEDYQKLATGKKPSKEPENLFGQLEFRDMYAAAESGTPFFDRIRGNHLSRFINWKLQNKYDVKGEIILPRPRGDPADEELFAAWREGRTGFPWIDAVMRQLRIEGWIHHLARHSVACFLTRGQAYVSWERGMEVFDEWLLDWDPCSNPGNWMWLSCSAFFSQYFRVYGLESWPKRTDTSGALVRKYCPELNGFPDKYIYAPHIAPASVQAAAKCIIGKDYPAPILDEQLEKARCIARLKIAFDAGFHGDSPEVLNGSAARILDNRYADQGGDKPRAAIQEEERARKRKKDGNSSLDAFVKRTKT